MVNTLWVEQMTNITNESKVRHMASEKMFDAIVSISKALKLPETNSNLRKLVQRCKKEDVKREFLISSEIFRKLITEISRTELDTGHFYQLTALYDRNMTGKLPYLDTYNALK